MQQSSEVMNWVLKQDPSTVREWLHRVWEGQQEIPHDFDWQNLTATIDIVAKSGNGPHYYSRPDLEWAKIAILLYQHLIDKADTFTRISLEDKMMELKAQCICHLGTVTGDPILGSDQYTSWFFLKLHLSIEEAEERSSHVETLEYEELWRLANIKNRLSVIKTLSDRGIVKPDEKLGKWLSIQEKLP